MLVLLSISSLVYLVYVSMQSVSFSPCALLNGTWLVSPDEAHARARMLRRGVGGGGGGNAVDDADSDVVNVDLGALVDYGDSNESLEMPAGALPIDLAPAYVHPLYITRMRKTYHGGAKVLFWGGGCRSKIGAEATNANDGAATATATAENTKKQQRKRVPSSTSRCVFMLYRGQWTLSVFPGNLSSADDFASLQPPGTTHAPLTIVASRLDSTENMEEAVFARKVKYVMAIMAVVAIIHHCLSVFQPPTLLQMRRDQARRKLQDQRAAREAVIAVARSSG